jgi:meiotically up-regulated gene 157 (Mug157) protein
MKPVPEPEALPAFVRSLNGVVSERARATFERIMRDNLRGVARWWDDGTAFIVTGDIPAMWLRDSAAQLRPYLLLCADDEPLQDLLVAVLRRQVEFLLSDPYANAFAGGTRSEHRDSTAAGPQTWERKFELDSLCFPVELAYRLFRITGRDDVLDGRVRHAFDVVLDVLQTEQDHERRSEYAFERHGAPSTDTLVRAGRGRDTARTGLVWSGFRPSDDACVLGNNIPGNMFVAVALGYIAVLADEVFRDAAMRDRAAALRALVDAAITEHGIVSRPETGDVFAYEVDGRGAVLLMDDANMPSLLSAPLTGYVSPDDTTYLSTRRFVLSSRNPYFFAGARAAGVGSPHTPDGHAWPIAIAVRGLTAVDVAEKTAALDLLLRTTGGTGRMHESFDVDDPFQYTRPWFSWADAMFCELVMDVGGLDFSALESERLPQRSR